MDEKQIKYKFYLEDKMDAPFCGGNAEELEDELDIDVNYLKSGQEFEHKGSRYKIIRDHSWHYPDNPSEDGLFVLCEEINVN